MVKVIGSEHVGFGFDFCTPYYESDELLDVMTGYDALPHLIETLENRGYQESTIRNIVGENWFRYFLNHLK
jgi:microsomal dipeptidase-like Zn-dependent dipeptidase